MLQTLRQNMELIQKGLPVYGMNKGTVGFLMNAYEKDDLERRVNTASPAIIHPLRMKAKTKDGTFEALAINEVALLRQTHQAAHIEICVDNRVRMDHLIADGVLIATPAGSTAYNLSAHGPVVPLGADILPLTPISAFRPRRWRGALLKSKAHIIFKINMPEYRPVSATADGQEFRHVTQVDVRQDMAIALTLLFDPDHALDEKILREQFAT